MKPSEVLIGLGRPVAYYSKLAELCSSVTAGIFLCQFLYWHGKGSDPEGWIYKVQSEITEETALSRWEQETARKILCKLNILEEKYSGIPRKLYYRLNLDSLDTHWSLPIMRENHIMACGKTTLLHEGNQHANTETTTENTTENNNTTYYGPAGPEENTQIVDDDDSLTTTLCIKSESPREKFIRQWKYSVDIENKTVEPGLNSKGKIITPQQVRYGALAELYTTLFGLKAEPTRLVRMAGRLKSGRAMMQLMFEVAAYEVTDDPHNLLQSMVDKRLGKKDNRKGNYPVNRTTMPTGEDILKAYE